MVANTAPLVLGPQVAVARLLDILRGHLGRGAEHATTSSLSGLIEACSSLPDGTVREAVAAEALSLMPSERSYWQGDPSYDLAVGST